MKKYIIGVDGGNTKTDYLLFDLEGNFVDGVRCGTCSHESPKIGSFNGAYIEMNNQITNLLKRNNLTIEDVESGAFGLAGVDAPFQKKALEEAEFSATAGGGAVAVTVSGKKMVTKVTLDPDAVDPDDVEMLEDLIMVAVNDAMKQVDEANSSSMARMTGGMGGFPF